MTSIVTIKEATTMVRCGPDGGGEHVFTVTNVSGAPLRVGAKVLIDNPEHAKWLSIDGPAERDLAVKTSDRVTVRIQAPADTPAGKYTFRLLVFSTAQPGEDFTEGETVAFEVPAREQPQPVEPPKKQFPWWIVAASAAGVLVIAGVVTWLLWPKLVEVPTLTDKNFEQAAKIVFDSRLQLGEPKQQTSNKPAFTVLSQRPEAGTYVKRDTVVTLTVSVRAGENTVKNTQVLKSMVLPMYKVQGLQVKPRWVEEPTE